MLADTGFLVDLMAGDAGAIAKLDELVAEAEAIAVAAVTVSEVRRAVTAEEARAVLDDVLADLPVIPVDETIAGRTAALLEAREDSTDDATAGIVHGMIAATAVERGEPILTRNVEAFDRFPGVRVVPY